MARSKEHGFTLVELLTVVSIVGILASIAIPQFSEYRARAYDARANSDLKNAIDAEEAYFATNETYVTCAGAACTSPALPAFHLSDGVVLTMTGDADGFTGVSSHPDGTREYTFSTAVGVIVAGDPGGGAGMAGP